MAHGERISEQWAAEPLPMGASDPCGSVQPLWPYRCCTLERGHKGELHCNERQAGTQVVRVWWAGTLEVKP